MTSAASKKPGLPRRDRTAYLISLVSSFTNAPSDYWLQNVSHLYLIGFVYRASSGVSANGTEVFVRMLYGAFTSTTLDGSLSLPLRSVAVMR